MQELPAAAIVNHPDVNKIAFTGSTDVGKIIQRAIAGTNKKATLELGGKTANIIFEDAPLDQAVEGVINGIYFNQGTCMLCRLQDCMYRVSSETGDQKLKDRLESLIVGDPLDKNTDIMPSIQDNSWETIHKYIKIGKQEGAEMYEKAVAPCQVKVSSVAPP